MKWFDERVTTYLKNRYGWEMRFQMKILVHPEIFRIGIKESYWNGNNLSADEIKILKKF